MLRNLSRFAQVGARTGAPLQIPLILLLVLFTIVFIPSQGALAATLTVNVTGVTTDTPDGDGNCTLIDAIQEANTAGTEAADCGLGDAGADTIVLSGDVTLDGLVTFAVDGANGLPSVNSNITIEGAGYSIARSSAGGTPNFRIFHVASGGDLTLNNVTASNGNAITSPNNLGGGIYNLGTLNINNSTLSGNSSSAQGGGIRNVGGGTVNINNSTLSGNSSTNSYGGGIANQGTLTISNSTLSGNSAVNGGGIQTEGSMNMDNSTLSGNWASSNGGGIYSPSGFVQISYSTLWGNRASGFYTGGGIYTGTNIRIDDTIVTNSDGGDCILIPASGGSFSGFSNLAGDGCAPISLGAVTNLDPVLADNGGPTWTHALLPGSNAINNAGSTIYLIDQRGVNAVGRRDIGAFELVIPLLYFSVDTLAIYEDGSFGPTVATVTVTLDNTAGYTPPGTVTVDFFFTGTASEGPTVANDYQLGGTALPLTFSGATWPAAGTFVIQTFTLTVWDDALIEGIETINLMMTYTGPASLNSSDNAAVVVFDDDTAPAPEQCTTCEQCAVCGERESITVVSDPDYIEKTVDNPMATGGDTVTYTITAHNPKDIPLTQVAIYDVFDQRLENVRLISTTHGFGTFNEDTLTVSGFTLQPGESATVAVSAQVTTDFRAGDVIPNIAALESPDASVHVSNLVLVGDSVAGNGGGAETVMVIPGQLPSTGETPLWTQSLASPLVILIVGTGIIVRRILSDRD